MSLSFFRTEGVLVKRQRGRRQMQYLLLIGKPSRNFFFKQFVLYDVTGYDNSFYIVKWCKFRLLILVFLILNDASLLTFLLIYSCDVQKVKSSIRYHSINPEWNEELTLSITNMMLPVKIVSSSAFPLTFQYLQPASGVPTLSFSRSQDPDK